MKKLILNIFIAIGNVIFFIAYFLLHLVLMPFHGFKLPKVSPFHVSNPFRGYISVKEVFDDEYVQSREFPLPKNYGKNDK